MEFGNEEASLALSVYVWCKKRHSDSVPVCKQIQHLNVAQKCAAGTAVFTQYSVSVTLRKRKACVEKYIKYVTS